MVILNGKYSGSDGLVYQLTDEAGQPATGSYHGPRAHAVVNRDERGRLRVVIGDPRTATFLQVLYLADEPTPESLAYAAGWSHGAAQKRKVAGASWSDDFRSGWWAAWQVKARRKEAGKAMFSSYFDYLNNIEPISF